MPFLCLNFLFKIVTEIHLYFSWISSPFVFIITYSIGKTVSIYVVDSFLIVSMNINVVGIYTHAF